MGATVGPNVALTNFIARDIIRKIAKEASIGNDCESTEELLSEIEKYNRMRKSDGSCGKKLIIASMDIDKWFPSMRIKPMTREIKDMIVKSGIEFKEINYENVAKYLGERMTIKEIMDEEMEEMKLKNLMKTKN